MVGGVAKGDGVSLAVNPRWDLSSISLWCRSNSPVAACRKMSFKPALAVVATGAVETQQSCAAHVCTYTQSTNTNTSLTDSATQDTHKHIRTYVHTYIRTHTYTLAYIHM